MIHDVDQSLREITRRDVLNGANVEVSFDAPTSEWSARRNAPTLNLYLYDIREDLDRREVQHEEIRDEHGIVIERRPPPRRFKLSYMITAWTQRPEDEHRLLASTLSCFLRFDALPRDILQGELAQQPYPVRATVGLPLPADRSISDVWTALGGELKPSLDLIVTAPFLSGRHQPVGPPVTEPPRLEMVGPDGAQEQISKRTPAESNGQSPKATRKSPGRRPSKRATSPRQ